MAKRKGATVISYNEDVDDDDDLMPSDSEEAVVKSKTPKTKTARKKNEAENVVQSLEGYTKNRLDVPFHPSQFGCYMYREVDGSIGRLYANESSIRSPLLGKITNGMLGNILDLDLLEPTNHTFHTDQPKLVFALLKMEDDDNIDPKHRISLTKVAVGENYVQEDEKKYRDIFFGNKTDLLDDNELKNMQRNLNDPEERKLCASHFGIDYWDTEEKKLQEQGADNCTIINQFYIEKWTVSRIKGEAIVMYPSEGQHRAMSWILVHCASSFNDRQQKVVLDSITEEFLRNSGMDTLGEFRGQRKKIKKATQLKIKQKCHDIMNRPLDTVKKELQEGVYTPTHTIIRVSCITIKSRDEISAKYGDSMSAEILGTLLLNLSSECKDDKKRSSQRMAMDRVYRDVTSLMTKMNQKNQNVIPNYKNIKKFNYSHRIGHKDEWKDAQQDSYKTEYPDPDYLLWVETKNYIMNPNDQQCSDRLRLKLMTNGTALKNSENNDKRIDDSKKWEGLKIAPPYKLYYESVSANRRKSEEWHMDALMANKMMLYPLFMSALMPGIEQRYARNNFTNYLMKYHTEPGCGNNPTLAKQHIKYDWGQKESDKDMAAENCHYGAVVLLLSGMLNAVLAFDNKPDKFLNVVSTFVRAEQHMSANEGQLLKILAHHYIEAYRIAIAMSKQHKKHPGKYIKAGKTPFRSRAYILNDMCLQSVLYQLTSIYILFGISPTINEDTNIQGIVSISRDIMTPGYNKRVSSISGTKLIALSKLCSGVEDVLAPHSNKTSLMKSGDSLRLIFSVFMGTLLESEQAIPLEGGVLCSSNQDNGTFSLSPYVPDPTKVPTKDELIELTRNSQFLPAAGNSLLGPNKMNLLELAVCAFELNEERRHVLSPRDLEQWNFIFDKLGHFNSWKYPLPGIRSKKDSEPVEEEELKMTTPKKSFVCEIDDLQGLDKEKSTQSKKTPEASTTSDKTVSKKKESAVKGIVAEKPRRENFSSPAKQAVEKQFSISEITSLLLVQAKNHLPDENKFFLTIQVAKNLLKDLFLYPKKDLEAYLSRACPGLTLNKDITVNAAEFKAMKDIKDSSIMKHHQLLANRTVDNVYTIRLEKELVKEYFESKHYDSHEDELRSKDVLVLIKKKMELLGWEVELSTIADGKTISEDGSATFVFKGGNIRFTTQTNSPNTASKENDGVEAGLLTKKLEGLLNGKSAMEVEGDMATSDNNKQNVNVPPERSSYDENITGDKSKVDLNLSTKENKKKSSTLEKGENTAKTSAAKEMQNETAKLAHEESDKQTETTGGSLGIENTANTTAVKDASIEKGKLADDENAKLIETKKSGDALVHKKNSTGCSWRKRA